jgi:hypothetical protein
MKKLIALSILGTFLAVPAIQAGCCGDKTTAKKDAADAKPASCCPAMTGCAASQTTAKAKSARSSKNVSSKKFNQPSAKGAEVLAKL